MPAHPYRHKTFQDLIVKETSSPVLGRDTKRSSQMASRIDPWVSRRNLFFPTIRSTPRIPKFKFWDSKPSWKKKAPFSPTPPNANLLSLGSIFHVYALLLWIPKQIKKKKKKLLASTPTLKFGKRGGVRVGKNKFRLQYPGCGVLSNELWRTVTNPFF